MTCTSPSLGKMPMKDSTARRKLEPPIALANYLTRRAIFDRYRRTTGATERTHWQVIYLKSQGKVVREIASVTGYDKAWIRSLIHRYNAVGPDAFIVDPPPEIASAELRAEYERKSGELDTARQAQQEMLQVQIPKHPELDIAAFLKTASEVGGDYYDFLTGNDGSITMAIGDATGHGTRSGMMVIATKSLFKALGGEEDLLGLIRRMTSTLKSLQIRGTYMHLTLGRYHVGKLELVVAGMPPVMVYRSATNEVEDVVLKGMPLGSFTQFPYELRVVELAEGDAAFLMSDGLTELVSPSGEMLEINRIREFFCEAGSGSAADIISDLRKAGLAWRADRPLKDDVTMVVLKRRMN